MYIRITNCKIGQLNWKPVKALVKANESYLHNQRKKRHHALLDKFPAVRKQYSHVTVALLGLFFCLFVSGAEFKRHCQQCSVISCFAKEELV